MIWQAVAFFVGIGVMAAPDLLGFGGTVADAFHILGPIAASVAGMAFFAILRPVRRVHLLVGPLIGLAPIVFGGSAEAIAVGVLAGAALVVLAFPGDAKPGQYGGGWRALFSNTEPRTTPEDH